MKNLKKKKNKPIKETLIGRAKFVHKGWNIISKSSKEQLPSEENTMDGLLAIAKGTEETHN